MIPEIKFREFPKSPPSPKSNLTPSVYADVQVFAGKKRERTAPRRNLSHDAAPVYLVPLNDDAGEIAPAKILCASAQPRAVRATRNHHRPHSGEWQRSRVSFSSQSEYPRVCSPTASPRVVEERNCHSPVVEHATGRSTPIHR